MCFKVNSTQTPLVASESKILSPSKGSLCSRVWDAVCNIFAKIFSIIRMCLDRHLSCNSSKTPATVRPHQLTILKVMRDPNSSKEPKLARFRFLDGNHLLVSYDENVTLREVINSLKEKITTLYPNHHFRFFVCRGSPIKLPEDADDQWNSPFHSFASTNLPDDEALRLVTGELDAESAPAATNVKA